MGGMPIFINNPKLSIFFNELIIATQKKKKKGRKENPYHHQNTSTLEDKHPFHLLFTQMHSEIEIYYKYKKL